MTPEELRQAAAVMLAAADGAAIEYRSSINGNWRSFDRANGDEPSWDWDCCSYRVAVIKPSINWGHVHPDYIAMAVDEDGEAFLFMEQPYIGREGWFSGSGIVECIVFASFVPGDCHWKDSLVLRPENS